MAQAARDYLAIPASEVDVERLFPDGRDILDIHRYESGSRMMGKLVMLKDYLRRKEQDLFS